MTRARAACRTAAALLGAAAFSLACAALAAPDAHEDHGARHDHAGHAGADAPARRRLVEDGERLLSSGDAPAAEQAFDRATQMRHEADAELALVRTYMQAGQYRRAAGFASHAAGAHRDEPAGTALYAWLLHIGAQTDYAARVLDEALQRRPLEPSLLQVRDELGRPWPLAGGPLAARPLRLMPYATGSAVPPGARVACSGVLSADARWAVAPASALADAAQILVRDGLGRTRAAQQAAAPDAAGLVLLRLDSPLPALSGLAAPAREPFAGSPASVVEYAASNAAEPAWPLLRTGFLGRPALDGASRALGIDTPPGPRGGPVFDRAGRLAGIALAQPGSADRMVPISAFAAPFVVPPADPSAGTTAAPVDAVYETALRVALQVIVAR